MIKTQYKNTTIAELHIRKALSFKTIIVPLVILMLVSAIFLKSNETPDFIDQASSSVLESMEELVPPVSLNQTVPISPDISETEFNEAEVTIAIGYELHSALKISIGVERSLSDTIDGSGSSSDLENLTSKTRLSSIAYQKEELLWKEGVTNPNITKESSTISKNQNTYNVTVFSAKVKEFGFQKEDLAIERGQCHWFVVIKDNNPKPHFNGSENFTRSVGWLASFNITLESIRYSSLLHPVFAAGWEVTASISGLACEIFHKVAQEELIAGGGASVTDYQPHYTSGTKLFGVAGLVGIAEYDSLWDDIPGVYDEFPILLETLEDTGIWEIYYMVSSDDEDWINDEDVEYLIGTLVTNAIGNPAVVDHCFWWIVGHGRPDIWGNGYIATSSTVLDSEAVWWYELGDMLDVITSRNVWVFYWMPNCYGNAFDDFWDEPDYHHNRALFWYYDGLSYNKKVCQEALRDHITYGQKSAQWMFGQSGKTDHEYKNYNSGPHEYVDFINYTYENQPNTNDMLQEDNMNGYEFCFVPNSNGWLSTCRTRGEPSTEVEDDCDFTVDPYMLYAYEVSPGTYDRYVGFYKRVYIPNIASGLTNLHVEFEGRARSNYAGSTVTNLYVAVYSADWQDRIGSPYAFVAGNTTDSGWDSYSHTFSNVPRSEHYNVLIYYSDSWSTNWYQKINIKNTYVGNVYDDTDGDGMHDDWEDNYTPVLDPTVNDADEDPDCDGDTNYVEYLADTNPVVHNYPPDMLSEDIVFGYNGANWNVDLKCTIDVTGDGTYWLKIEYRTSGGGWSTYYDNTFDLDDGESILVCDDVTTVGLGVNVEHRWTIWDSVKTPPPYDTEMDDENSPPWYP